MRSGTHISVSDTGGNVEVCVWMERARLKPRTKWVATGSQDEGPLTTHRTTVWWNTWEVCGAGGKKN